ncbi:uncharacterized protein [Venturia canescens]|uniref:uncharacterized protein n=1 Tax=Venturia canescens TaxID=32260 RepID=UPI001C9C6772|nr:uncharacterized protein LOC122411093 [Venturia canescens]
MSDEPGASKITGKRDQSLVQDEHCDRVQCKAPERDNEEKKETVSVTYNEMISRGPTPCAEQYSIADFFAESGYFEATKDGTLEETRENEDPRRTTLADLSTKEMVKFLNSSRAQHIEIIKKEIERLYGLERFMENFPMDGFDAFLSKDLAKRMEDLENQMVAKKTNKSAKEN